MKTSFKALVELGFRYEKGDMYNESYAQFESQDSEDCGMRICKDGYNNFRMIVDCYHVGQPLNTIAKVKNVMIHAFGIKIK
jgi:hypothetical protein